MVQPEANALRTLAQGEVSSVYMLWRGPTPYGRWRNARALVYSSSVYVLWRACALLFCVFGKRQERRVHGAQSHERYNKACQGEHVPGRGAYRRGRVPAEHVPAVTCHRATYMYVDNRECTRPQSVAWSTECHSRRHRGQKNKCSRKRNKRPPERVRKELVT